MIGFQKTALLGQALIKCPAWVATHELGHHQHKLGWGYVEKDHAKIGQFLLQSHIVDKALKPWAIVVGSHHGRVFEWPLRSHDVREWASNALNARRQELFAELLHCFGPLPTSPPTADKSNLWLVAGLITVSDWIGSNEQFFPADANLTLEETRAKAQAVLSSIGLKSGSLQKCAFATAFSCPGASPLQQNPLQKALYEAATAPGLFIVEGPMGCGKTEAALFTALRLINEHQQQGLYFALPTQVTSNRIFTRVEEFLQNVVDSKVNFRLSHSASWLSDAADVTIHPAAIDHESKQHAVDGKTWFSSAKHALLASYGVGTIDQALLGVIATKHFFVRRFGLAGKVVILDEVHSYDVYTSTLLTHLVKQLLALRCSVIILSATLTQQRRRELMEAAGVTLPEQPNTSYPLITTGIKGNVKEIPVEWAETKAVSLKVGTFSLASVLEECLQRARAGQHVLYIRNTVADAIEH